MEDTTPDYGKCPCTGQYQNRTIEVLMRRINPRRAGATCCCELGLGRPPSRTGPETARPMHMRRTVEVAPVPGGSAMNTAAPRPPKIPPPWFVHTAWRAHRALYRLSGGRFLWTTSNKRGWGALRLTTIGRKSGQERSVIIGYLEEGPNLVALAMNGWDEGHPSWWLNLEAHPDAVVRLAGQHPRPVRAARPRGTSVIGFGSAGSRSIRRSTRTAGLRSTETPVVVLEPRDGTA